MKQPELEIIRFNSEDVIATSGIVEDSSLEQHVDPTPLIPDPGVWG